MAELHPTRHPGLTIVCEPCGRRGRHRSRREVGDSADGLLNRGLARRDFGHPLLGVLSPRARDLDVFRTVSLHKICAGNHSLRIECAHHWIIDRWSPHHVDRGLCLAIGVRQRGRANKNDNRIHDGPRFRWISAGWRLRMPLASLRTHQVATSCNIGWSQNPCRDLDHSAVQHRGRQDKPRSAQSTDQNYRSLTAGA
jgi:hypothetical protein